MLGQNKKHNNEKKLFCITIFSRLWNPSILIFYVRTESAISVAFPFFKFKQSCLKLFITQKTSALCNLTYISKAYILWILLLEQIRPPGSFTPYGVIHLFLAQPFAYHINSRIQNYALCVLATFAAALNCKLSDFYFQL